VAGSTSHYPRRSLGDETRVVVADAATSMLTHAHARVPLTVPEGARLELAYGVEAPESFSAPVSFAALVRSGGNQQTLFAATVGPQEAPYNEWNDVTVDLAGLEGEIELELTTACTEPGTAADPDSPIANAYFSAPVVTVPSRDPPRHNVVLISLDTLRADHVGLYGYSRPTTPNIDRVFGEQGVVVERVVSTSTDTLNGHTSMLTGLYPTVALVRRGKTVLPWPWVVSLAGILRSAGYRTAAFTENAYVGANFGFDRGFERYAEEKSIDDHLQARGSIETTFARGRAWLDTIDDQQFFLFLHTYQVHAPYTPPPRYAAMFPSPPDATTIRRQMDAYDAEIAYTDEQVGKLISHIDELGLERNTLVIVTSDHGEEFGEHGGRQHGPHLHSEVLHVPWMMRARGLLPAAGRRKGPASLNDMLPTVLELLGLTAPYPPDGRSLAGHLTQGSPIPVVSLFSEARTLMALTTTGRDRAWLSPSFSLTRWPDRLIRIRTHQGPRYELYDLDVDPAETENIYGPHALRVAHLRTALDFYEQHRRDESTKRARSLGVTNLAPSHAVPGLDREREKKLRALGYLN